MKTISLVLASLVLCCLAAAPAQADAITILSVTGTFNTAGGIPVGGSQFGGVAESQFIGISFTVGRAFDDVSISIPDMVFFNWAASAWLTNGIGPAATSQNVIATTTIDVGALGGSVIPANTTFLSGLTLSPGTYFFFLSSPFCPDNDSAPGCGFGLWPVVSNATINAAPNAAFSGEELVGGFILPCQTSNCPAANFAFPPASPWTFMSSGFSTPLAFDITGGPLPEPSSLMLFGAGLLTLLAAGRKKTGQHIPKPLK